MKIKINPEVLGRDITTLRGISKTMSSNLKDMKGSIDNLASSWDGEAKDTFVQSYNADYAIMTQIVEMMNQYLNTLQDAKNKYVITGNKVQDIVSRIQI